VELKDWKEILKEKVSVSTQTQVANELGVSVALINQVVRDKYTSKNTKLSALVKHIFAPELLKTQEANWLQYLKDICSIYSVNDVAQLLDVTPSFLHGVVAGRYSSGCHKLRTSVVDKLLDTQHLSTLRVKEARKSCKKRKCTRTESHA